MFWFAISLFGQTSLVTTRKLFITDFSADPPPMAMTAASTKTVPKPKPRRVPSFMFIFDPLDCATGFGGNAGLRGCSGQVVGVRSTPQAGAAAHDGFVRVQ